jgi:anti-anti-sigma factor
VLLEIDVRSTESNIPVLHLRGEIDLHTCGGFRDKLRELIELGNYAILIDLTEVPYLDSAALGVLVDAERRVREHEGRIGLVGATPFVRRAFEITRLIRVFKLYEDMATAAMDTHTPAAA